MKNFLLTSGIASMALFLPCNPVYANLEPIFSLNGPLGVSIDGLGSNNSPTGNIDAIIPDSATVIKAYLYTALTPTQSQTLPYFNSGQISLAGTPITNYSAVVGIQGYSTARADVTSLVNSLKTGGNNYSWQMSEGSNNFDTDGHALVVVYSDSSLPVSSVAILDGGQAQGGDTTTVNFAAPLKNVSDPNFFFDMSLGISYSYNDANVDQFSNVDVNGQRLTSSAGSNDDGIPQYIKQDGALMTVGGIGDSNSNPNPTAKDRAADDELYSLVPFLKDGDTGFTMVTNNPSLNDNIFLMTLHSGVALKDVNGNPVPTVPVPAAIWFMSSGLLGWGFLRKPKNKPF